MSTSNRLTPSSDDICSSYEDGSEMLSVRVQCAAVSKSVGEITVAVQAPHRVKRRASKERTLCLADSPSSKRTEGTVYRSVSAVLAVDIGLSCERYTGHFE